MPHDSNNKPRPQSIKVMSRIHYQRRTQEIPQPLLNKQLKEDDIAVEEPLQISLTYFDLTEQQYQTRKLSITMRTPGDDHALVYGFLLCEGIIKDKKDIIACEFNMEQHQGNAVCVLLAEHVKPNWKVIERQFTNHSSCGICGKTSLNALQLKSPTYQHKSMLKLNHEHVFQLPALLRQQQAIFSKTGGLHAAGLYGNKQFLYIAEDIGRHNALDKVIGAHCLDEANLQMLILVLSGRISFELVQKAIMANIQVIVSVGAPSSLAITAAKQFNLTLIGFTKADSFNVYHGDWRIH